MPIAGNPILAETEIDKLERTERSLMSASKTTEQLVDDCFVGVACKIYPHQTWQSLARAARQFVRMEQAEKLNQIRAKLLKQGQHEAEVANEQTDGWAKLPKHWGELKVGGKWVKF